MATGKIKPRIAITIGEAAGIGPEIVVKALRDRILFSRAEITIIGDLEHMIAAAKLFTEGDLTFLDAVTFVDLKNLPSKVEFGKDSPITGKASGEYIVKAVEMCMNGEIDAVITAPISKASLHLGGFDYPGHTELLAELSGTSEFAMSFFADDLRVVLLSTHISLKKAIEMVTADRLESLIRFTYNEMSRLLGRKPKIAVAGLNPHASEGGMFGDEEEKEIIPAINACRIDDMDVVGPLPPDTIFRQGADGAFDVCIALYHDQGTIPIKLLSFETGVNVTLGLPFIRTSVDHGTAYDIAGKGIADERNMKAAINLAIDLSNINIEKV